MTRGVSGDDQGYPQPQDSADQEEGSAKSSICCLQGCLASTAVGFGFFVALPSGILLVIYAANKSDVTLLAVGGALLALPLLTLVVVVLLCFNQRRLARLRKNKVTMGASSTSTTSTTCSSTTSSISTYALPAPRVAEDDSTTTSSLSSTTDDSTVQSSLSAAKEDCAVTASVYYVGVDSAICFSSPFARNGSVTKPARDACSTTSSSTVSSFASSLSLSETNSATPLVGKSSVIQRTFAFADEKEEEGKAPLAAGPTAAGDEVCLAGPRGQWLVGGRPHSSRPGEDKDFKFHLNTKDTRDSHMLPSCHTLHTNIVIDFVERL